MILTTREQMLDQLNTEPNPAICVFVADTVVLLNELLNGIEEEGLPYEIKTVAASSAVELAYLAAQQSQLSVGIGLDATHAAVHYTNLKAESPLFHINYHVEPCLRALGANAARLVKGTPFLLLK